MRTAQLFHASLTAFSPHLLWFQPQNLMYGTMEHEQQNCIKLLFLYMFKSKFTTADARKDIKSSRGTFA